MKHVSALFRGISRFSALIALGLAGAAVFAQSPEETGMELQSILDRLVKRNRIIESCAVSVSKGDGSFSWSGAAGTARPAGNGAGGVAMTPQIPYYIASITKLFTATVIMQLCEENALSPDDPMAAYLPEGLVAGIHVYEGADYSREITIGQLLSHSSGIADYYSEKPRGGRSLYGIFLEDPGRHWTVEETIARARDELEPNFIPGTDTSYSDTNFQLLGKIIESVTGKPLHEVFEERIFGPLGLESTWLAGHPRRPGTEGSAACVYAGKEDITRIRTNGSYWADGGIVSTAEDCVSFLRALNRGELIEPGTLQMMHRWREWRFPLKYGYGTMYFDPPSGAGSMMHVPPLWGHSGSTGSFLYYSEDLDVYAAGTLNQTSAEIKPFVLIGRILRAVSDRDGI